MAKTKLQMQDISDVLAAAIEPFQAPPLVAAPYTTITDLSGNARKLPDPSKTIRPLFGIERVHTKSAKLVQNEKGPNGEPVYKIDNDERIRFVGNGWYNDSVNQGPKLVTASTTDYVEITFYGNSLNILNLYNTTLDVRVSIDGGAEGANILGTGSGILSGRNYSANQIVEATTTLTLTTHTVKIRNNGAGLGFYGFEIVGPSANITIPQGKAVNNGKAATVNNASTITYNSGFASGTDNGRGGRVVIYKGSNGIEKALQPVDSTTLYLTSTSHVNEEMIHKTNFRNFGRNRADDFSSAAAASTSRAFTLDDGTTSLVGSTVVVPAANNDVGIGFNSTASTITLTFVGSGLDIISDKDNVGGTFTINTSIDGTLRGTIVPGDYTSTEAPTVIKVCSGLPYGTHTVTFQPTGTFTLNMVIRDFVVYGPKKPTIPEGAVEFGEYYLMANYVVTSNNTNSAGFVSTGVLRKMSNRELVFTGTWNALSLDATNFDSGWNLSTNTSGSSFEYTFFGTGVELELNGASNALNNTITIDGTNPTAAGATTTSLVYSGTGLTFAAGTGLLSGTGTVAGRLRVQITGLTLGKHKVKFTTNNASFNYIDTLDIITPIHYPNTKLGSLALKSAIEVKQQKKENNLDLSKAKAWLIYDGANQKILQAYNIRAVLRVTTGSYWIYFDKNFKTSSYVINGSVSKTAFAGGQFISFLNESPVYRRPNSIYAEVRNNADAIVDPDAFMITVYGELEDEGN